MTNNATITRFNQASEHYQTNSIKYRKMSADRVSQLVMPASKDVILDMGCGTGSQLIELSGSIKKGIGIDISPGMIKRANEQRDKVHAVNLEFHRGDFLTPEREIQLGQMKINKIITNYALHHLCFSDKKRALDKIIDIVGGSLEMVVIGDLMFFDDPEKYSDQYAEIGYGRGIDLPSYADELAELFDENAFVVTLDRIHPLVGVLKAIRKKVV